MEITGIDHWEESSEPGADVSGRGRGRMSQGEEGEPDKHRLLSFQHLSLERTREQRSRSGRIKNSKPGLYLGPRGGGRAQECRQEAQVPPGHPEAQSTRRSQLWSRRLSHGDSGTWDLG